MDTSEPPFLLDAARVMEYAALRTDRGQRRSVVVDGVSMDTDTISRLVIAESLADGAVFLLHCNANWETVAAGRHADAAAARAAAESAYQDLAPRWERFRPLSGEEEREIATTRSFLRALADGDGI